MARGSGHRRFEDGLYLNIWTPARAADEGPPVMVWIHGGGMQEASFIRDGVRRRRVCFRGVILVSVGYRLNVFGFLTHPEITAENPDAPSNFTLLDQAAAIKWVKRNIANFGGDPGTLPSLVSPEEETQYSSFLSLRRQGEIFSGYHPVSRHPYAPVSVHKQDHV